jgi:dihydropyrimidinase
MKRKQKGDSIWKAAMGIGFTTYTLPVLLSEGVRKRGLRLEKLVEVCCFNPAKAFGLYPKKGTIEVGSDADIVVVDIDKKVKARLEDTYSMYEFNIYEGWEFTGFPVLTMVRGNIVMEEGKVIGKEGTGRHIPVYLTK